MSDLGHNSGETIGGIRADALCQYVSRIEQLCEERKAISDDVSMVYKEAVATGFDRKALKALITERSKDASALAETNEIVDLYRRAVGGTRIATRMHTDHDE